MKRLLAIVLSVVLLMAAIPFSAVFAGDAATFAAGEVSGSRGQEVIVPITVLNNPGISSMKLQIGYDSSVLEVKNCAFKDFTGGVNGTSPLTDNPFLINWADTLNGNNTNNGVLANVTFAIKADAAFGDTTITISYDPDDVYDVNWDNVEFATQSGKVTVVCTHINTENVPAKESTCLEPGNNAYTVCNDCGTVTVGSDEKLPLGACTGGTATCLEKATCSVCGEPHGDFGTHTLTNHPANAADHFKGGNIEYWTCDVCGKFFADAKGADEIDEVDTLTSVVPHEHSAKWSKNETQHWHECSCGDKIDMADHFGGTATCKVLAACDACGKAYGEYAAHELTHHAAVDATHAAGGNIEYWTCDVCGKYFTDAAGKNETTEAAVKTNQVPHDHSTEWSKDANQHWHACECGDKTSVANHTYTNSCDTTCNVCGYTRTIEHTWETTWTKDATNHWHKCSVCGETKDTAAHEGGTATCKDKKVCTVCSQAYGTVDANNHVGETEVKDAREPKCNEKGYTGDTYCKDCGVKIATGSPIDEIPHTYSTQWSKDGVNHWHECSCGAKSDEAAHEGGTATCKDKKVCTVCSQAYGTVDATNHVGGTEVKDAREPKCNEEGYTGDTYCKGCGVKIATGTSIDKIPHTYSTQWSKDGTNHWHECSCGDKKDVAAHEGGTATCKDKKVCTVCAQVYGELLAHDYSAEVVNAKYLKSVATCTKKAVYYKSCTMCGLASTSATFETGDVNPDNHVGETEIKDALAPKCDAEGYTGDTYCKDCGVKIKDGVKIDKIPHVIKEWVVSKEATTEENGEKSGTCEGCNEIFVVETGKLVAEFKEEKVESSMEDVAIEIVGEDSNIDENVIFVAEEVADTIEETEKQTVQEAINTLKEEVEDHAIAAIFDLKLILRETTKTGEQIQDTKFELKGTVKVTVPVPAVVIEKFENLKLIHVKDDGTVEVVPFTMNNGKATFEATGFSYYTFVGTEKVPVVETPPVNDTEDKKDDTDTEDKKDNVDTGDTDTDGTKVPPTGESNTAVMFAVFAGLLALGYVTYSATKSKKTN